MKYLSFLKLPFIKRRRTAAFVSGGVAIATIIILSLALQPQSRLEQTSDAIAARPEVATSSNVAGSSTTAADAAPQTNDAAPTTVDQPSAASAEPSQAPQPTPTTSTPSASEQAQPATPPTNAPTPKPPLPSPAPTLPFNIFGSNQLTAPLGKRCVFGYARTNDHSAITWQIASPAAAWAGEVPSKYPQAPVYMYVDKPAGPTDSVTFCIQATYEARVGDVIEFYLHASDPGRNINQMFTVRVTVAEYDPAATNL